jgi:hypothetical protein
VRSRSGDAQITTKTTVTPVTVTEVKHGRVVLKSGNALIVRTDNDVKAFTQDNGDHHHFETAPSSVKRKCRRC